MKQRLLKILSVCMVSVCLVSVPVFAEDKEIDSAVQDIVVATAEGLTDAIVTLSEEDIENFKTSQDAFTASAVEAWDTNREELGEYKEKGETEVEYKDETYIATVPVTCENYDGEFVYVFEEATGAPTSLTVNVNLPMSVNMQRAGLNTLMGLGTVFIMLIFLSFVIYLMGKVCTSFQNKPKKAAEETAAPPVAAAPVVETVEEADDTELIAVIAAAIAAAEGTSPDGFVVRSVRKVNRRKW